MVHCRRRSFTPVTGTCASPSCCTGTNGYIAVGTSYPGQNDPQFSDVHVVRTDNNGGRIWEYTYDITGSNDWDYGWSIIECADGSGFVITGDTEYDGGSDVDVFLLKINCNGGVVWSRVYGAFNIVDGGRDLIETTTGDADSGTAAGDIVVAGHSYGPGPTAAPPNGYLLRVTANGILIWDRLYNYQPLSPPGYQDRFYSLAELTPSAGSTSSTGDIIAVGSTTQHGSTPGLDGLAVRVSGDNGTVGVAPQGAGKFGYPAGPDVLYSVVELQNPNDFGDVVLCGYFNHRWIDLIKLNGGDPCLVQTDKLITTPTTAEFLQGRTIRQVTFPPGAGSVSQWDLVLTGIYGVSAGTTQAFLLSAAPGNLAPGALAKHYGGSGNEEGWSVYPVDSTQGSRTFGFVLCGHTTTNWGSGTSQDMYLLKTNGSGATTCQSNLSVRDSSTTRYNCITVLEDDIMRSAMQSTTKTERRWGVIVCRPRSGASASESPELGMLPFGSAVDPQE